MANRAAKFASAVVAGILAGPPITMAQPAANSADCLTQPGQSAPQGQHWYYRLERGTKRHCWYLREAGAKVSPAASADDASSAPSAAEEEGQADAATRSLEDAHAELRSPQPRIQANAGIAAAQPAPPPAAAAPAATPPAASQFPDPQQAAQPASSVASRWPQTTTADSTASPPPAADPADAEPTAQAPATPVAAPAPAPNGPVVKDSAPAPVSLQMLFIVILGALALAGLTASVVYRLGRVRKVRVDARERRAAIWEGVEDAPQPPWVEPVIERTAPRPEPARAAVQTATPQERYQKIEEILAQLVKQAQQSDA
ncbi:hypothetical protein [Bradyrhizobium sp. ARR65]|uniref:hypothetical protein n=1 Tax=Bradyrhizobium sp. ARR65 TaxID=1040989 RepID=UPI000ADDC8EB|nr:hypothetical protein [Bradyrhizobium sp. ARR65]